MEKTYYIGLDVGSTTAKIAVIDSDNRVIYSKYERHNARVSPLYLAFSQMHCIEQERPQMGIREKPRKVKGNHRSEEMRWSSQEWTERLHSEVSWKEE